MIMMMMMMMILIYSANPTKDQIPTGKANIVVNALSRSRPPLDVDPKVISSKTQSQGKRAANIMYMDLSSPQDREILNSIQASSISLPKKEIQQFIVTQKTDLDIQKLAAQSKTEFKWKKLQLSPEGVLYRIENCHEQMFMTRTTL